MKMDWNQYLNHNINITMYENYGVVYGNKKDEHPTFYEIVFKTGKLLEANDQGIILEAVREGQIYKIYIPYPSIKCAEIF